MTTSATTQATPAPPAQSRGERYGRQASDHAGGDAARYEMSSWECLDRIRLEPVGRICINEFGYPLAFPINYRVIAESPVHCRIVMRTAPDTGIGRYHGRASLEVDRIELESGRAWSVIVRGDLQPMLGISEVVDPDPLIKTGRTRWMVLNGTAISGRRFVSRPTSDRFEVDWQAEK